MKQYSSKGTVAHIFKTFVTIAILSVLISITFQFIWKEFFFLLNFNKPLIQVNPDFSIIMHAINDSILVILSYYLIVLLSKDAFWYLSIKKKNYLDFVAVIIILSAAVEYLKIHYQIQEYLIFTPTLFGIAIFPLMHLALVGIATIILLQRFRHSFKIQNHSIKNN